MRCAACAMPEEDPMPDYRETLNTGFHFLSTAKIEILLFLGVVLVGVALFLALTPFPFVKRHPWICLSILPLLMGPTCFWYYLRVTDYNDIPYTFTGDPHIRLRLISLSVSSASVIAWRLFVAWIRKRTAGTGNTQFIQR